MNSVVFQPIHDDTEFVRQTRCFLLHKARFYFIISFLDLSAYKKTEQLTVQRYWKDIEMVEQGCLRFT